MYLFEEMTGVTSSTILFLDVIDNKYLSHYTHPE